VRSALEGIAGVQNVSIDNSAKTATVQFDSSSVSTKDLITVFDGTKFSAKVQG